MGDTRMSTPALERTSSAWQLRVAALAPATGGWTFTDFFCGYGGSSIGLTEAGGVLVWAANHWDRAIETHAANFRDADHFQGDISGLDMRRIPKADAAWISPECFTAGHLVTTLTRGQVPIERVQIGEKVLTHTGRFMPVVRTQSRVADTVIVKGQGHVGIETTASHSFWARASQRVWKNEIRDYRREYEVAGWMPAETLVDRQALWATPTVWDVREAPHRVLPSIFGHDPIDAAWLLGRWLGDGSLSFGRNSEVIISCSYEEADELGEVLARTGSVWARDRKRTAVNFRTGNHVARDWLERECGRGAGEKQVPTFLMFAPVSVRQATLDGYMSADGSHAKRHDAASSVSRRLAVSTRLLAESLGHRTSMTMDKRIEYMIEGRRGAARPQFSVFWHRNHSASRSPEAFEDGIHAWSRVRSVTSGRSNVTVYNIEVAEDHSYVLDGIVVKNCTWHSPAGGRKRVRADLDLFDDYVPDAAGERSRATMWDVVRAAEAKQFKVVVVENVVEVTSWPLFDRWLDSMETLGYEYQILCVSAAHIGGELNPHAPQWRDRIYFIFYRKGVPFPDVQPRPLAWCPQCEAVVESVQSWKRKDRRRIGKYGPQYVYVCAAGQHSSHVVEPYVLPATTAIDWSDLGERIGDRPLREFKNKKTGEVTKDHLAPATMRRVGVGIRMFARPLIEAAAGQTWDGSSSGNGGSYHRVSAADDAPLGARTGTAGDASVVPPFVASVNHGQDDSGRLYDPAERPLPSRSTKIGDAVVSPFLVERRDYDGADEGRLRGVDEPMATRTASDRGIHGMVVPGAFLSRQYNPRGEDIDHLNTSIDEPTHPITANGGGNHALIVPAGGSWNDTAYPATDPLRTRMTRDTEGIAFIDVARTNNLPHGVDEPLAPLTTGQNQAVVSIPFISEHYGETKGDERRNKSLDEPLGTIVAGCGHHELVTPPFVVYNYDHDGGNERRIKPVDGDPLGTVVANGRHEQLVTPPFVTEMRGTSTARGVDDALGTVTAGGNHHAVTVPDYVFIQKHHGGIDYAGISHMVKSIGEPLPSLVAKVNTSLVIPYRRGMKAYQAAGRPLHTLSTHDSAGLVAPDFTDRELRDMILNSRFRMLGPREHLRAQRFPDSYEVKGNKSEQTKGAGNAVASNVAHYIGAFIGIALGTGARRAA